MVSINDSDLSEHMEQVFVCQWLKRKGIFHFAVPNGGNRSITEAKRLKLEGVIAGVPDLVIAVDNTVIFLEMKVKSGGVLSKAQRFIHGILYRLGFEVLVGHGAIDAIGKLAVALEKQT